MYNVFFNNSIMEIDERRIAIFSIQAIYIIDTIHFTIEHISIKNEISSLLTFAILRNGTFYSDVKMGTCSYMIKTQKR